MKYNLIVTLVTPALLALFLLQRVSAATNYIILSLTKNGLLELRISYRGRLIMETSLARVKSPSNIVFSRASDGIRLVETVIRYGVITDCSTSTAHRDVSSFFSDFYQTPRGHTIDSESDLMDVYLKIREDPDSKFLLKNANNFIDSKFLGSDSRAKNASIFHESLLKNKTSFDNLSDFILSTKITHPKKSPFLKMFRTKFRIRKRIRECKYFYQTAAEHLSMISQKVPENGPTSFTTCGNNTPSCNKTSHSSENNNYHRHRHQCNRKHSRRNDHHHHEKCSDKDQTKKLGVGKNILFSQSSTLPLSPKRSSNFENTMNSSSRKVNNTIRFQRSIDQISGSLSPSFRRLESQSLDIPLSRMQHSQDQISIRFSPSLGRSKSHIIDIHSPRPQRSTDHISTRHLPSFGRLQSQSLNIPSSRLHRSTDQISTPHSHRNERQESHILDIPSSGADSKRAQTRDSSLQPRKSTASEWLPKLAGNHDNDVNKLDLGVSNSAHPSVDFSRDYPDRSKRDLLTGWIIFPGTKWCGDGDIAEHKKDMGYHVELDKCCRRHDLCPQVIPRLSWKYGMFNYRLHTLSHCRCDRRFRKCLKASSSPLAHLIGQIYFNVVGPQCFKFTQRSTCVHRFWWGGCREWTSSKVAYAKRQRRFK